jgi:hypothetical protein
MCNDLTFLGKHQIHRGKGSFPVPLFLDQLIAARSRDGIKLRAAAAFQLVPLALNPAFFREPVQGRKQRSRTNHKSAVRDLLDTICDADAM